MTTISRRCRCASCLFTAKVDKKYEDHLQDMLQDRPKEFIHAAGITPEQYVRDWCAKNALVYAPPAKPKKRRKLK